MNSDVKKAAQEQNAGPRGPIPFLGNKISKKFKKSEYE